LLNDGCTKVVASFVVGALFSALVLVCFFLYSRRNRMSPTAGGDSSARHVPGGRGASEETPLFNSLSSPCSSPPPVRARGPPNRMPPPDETPVHRASSGDDAPRLPTPNALGSFSFGIGLLGTPSANSHNNHSAHSVREVIRDDVEGGGGGSGSGGVGTYTRSGSAFKEVGLRAHHSLTSETSTIRNDLKRLAELQSGGGPSSA
jgi:hypothetical protein